MERLVWLIGRYGEAIEYDLHATFTLDLLDFFRHKYSWRKLEALLSRLPSGSAFWAAKADDDEAAAAWLAQSGDRPQRPVGPDLQEMSYTNQLLLDIKITHRHDDFLLNTDLILTCRNLHYIQIISCHIILTLTNTPVQ